MRRTRAGMKGPARRVTGEEGTRVVEGACEEMSVRRMKSGV